MIGGNILETNKISFKKMKNNSAVFLFKGRLISTEKRTERGGKMLVKNVFQGIENISL